MQLAPSPWTHHHTHRLFHISLGVCFAFVTGMLCAGFIVAWWQTTAADVTIVATVGSVEPGPTQITHGGKPQPPLQPTSPPTPTPTTPPTSVLPGTLNPPVTPGGQAFGEKGFALFLTIPDVYKKISAGANLVAFLWLYVPGEPYVKNITYELFGPNNQMIFSITMEDLPESKELVFKKSFLTRPNAHLGVYTLQAQVSRGKDVAVSGDTFEILPSPAAAGTQSWANWLATPLIILALLIVLLAFIIMIIFAYVKVRHLTRLIRQQHRRQYS